MAFHYDIYTGEDQNHVLFAIADSIENPASFRPIIFPGMDGPSRIPGFYPETPVAQRYNGLNGSGNSPVVGSIGRAGGPIRRTPAAAISRARAHSTPYARPPPQNTPGSGGRVRRDDDDDDEVSPFWRMLNV